MWAAAADVDVAIEVEVMKCSQKAAAVKESAQ